MYTFMVAMIASAVAAMALRPPRRLELRLLRAPTVGHLLSAQVVRRDYWHQSRRP